MPPILFQEKYSRPEAFHDDTMRLGIPLSACDPLNLIGILTPGARVPAMPQNRVVYVDGVPEDGAALRSA